MDGKPKGFRGTASLVWEDQPSGSPWKAVVDERTTDGWRVRSVWVGAGEVPILRELHVTPIDRRRVPDRGLTARRLDKLSHQAKLAMLQKRAPELFADEPEALAALDGLIHGDRKKLGGARGRSDLEYAKLALRYEELSRSSRRPIAELAQELVMSASRVRSMIHECRRRGLLTATTPGRAGGTATPEAHRIANGHIDIG